MPESEYEVEEEYISSLENGFLSLQAALVYGHNVAALSESTRIINDLNNLIYIGSPNGFSEVRVDGITAGKDSFNW